MSGKKHDEQASLAAGRAAGYCWAPVPGGGGHCTRRPGHDDEHVDYYNGRLSPTDTAGYRWPQR
ncbi:hypothetical protein ACF09J_13705 [Streptomyces sp. NPDC014889]|uniref:hypothetical protein n=1 Tax=Streptomyces sp. NPDC014889 TaxID=3364928 RepID=UPI0036FD2D2A